MNPTVQRLKFFLFVGIGLEVLLILGIVLRSYSLKDDTKTKNQLVKKFMLTDYCLSTESRHTRHLSSPEIIAPFQDFPAYLEHFPSSSFFQIPVSTRKK